MKITRREGCLIVIASMVLTAIGLTYLVSSLWPFIPIGEGPKKENYPWP